MYFPAFLQSFFFLADVDIFLEYPGHLLLSLAEMAQYKTLMEAKFYCAMKETCTGINSWPSRFSLVSGTEMVTATIRNAVYLKTSKNLFF